MHGSSDVESPYLDNDTDDPLQDQLIEELKAGRLRLATSDPKHRLPYFVNGQRRVHTVLEQVEPDPCPEHWRYRWDNGEPKEGIHHARGCFRYSGGLDWSTFVPPSRMGLDA